MNVDNFVFKHATLSNQFKQYNKNHPQNNFSLKIHRGLSWLKKAERDIAELKDYDSAFISYWIAFNALYVIKSGTYPTERKSINEFCEKIIYCDPHNRIYGLVQERFSDSVKYLLANKYVFYYYWLHQNTNSCPNWEFKLKKNNTQIENALRLKIPKLMLANVFDRLYVLRNQLVHGGSTWGSSVNYKQVEDGTMILNFIIPELIKVMLANPEKDWGITHYPVIESNTPKQ